MLTAMGDVMRRCYEKGWLTTRDGNVSVRKSLEGNLASYMYISPMGVRKNKIECEHMIKVPMSLNTELGNVSIEFHMHYNLLKDIKSTKAVLHCHPTNVVAALYAGWDLQEIAADFPELKRYTKVGPTVKFHEAGSSELANETNLNMRDGVETNQVVFDIVGQDRHGVCAIARDPWSAYEHIERLDHICEIVLKSGKKPKEKRNEVNMANYPMLPCS
jgi:L-fuculose-phosphate aldolase